MNKMNLRDEIKNFIWNNYSKDIAVLDSNVDKILKLFEKRIDELRKEHPRDLYGAYNAGLDDVIDDMLNEKN